MFHIIIHAYKHRANMTANSANIVN